MKKKLAMRIASLALCVVFTGMLFGVPKAKAVATEVAVGTAAVASYFQATGLTMAASAGATGALVTTGVADIAGSYAMATGAASSGSAFLSSLATGVSISPAGAIVLTAAAVVAIGALVAWCVNEKELDSEGASVTVLDNSGFYDTSGNFYPAVYRPASTSTDYNWLLYMPSYFYTFDSASYGLLTFGTNSSGDHTVSFNDYLFMTSASTNEAFAFVLEENATSLTVPVYVSCAVSSTYPLGYRLTGVGSADLSKLSQYGLITTLVEESLTVTRAPEFTQPDTELDAESQKQMVIDAGFAPGTTLDAAVEQVPELIVAGDFAPTYEISTVGTGEGTDTETPSDEETGIYIPILSDIKTALSNLGTSIVDGIKGLFVPSDAAIDSLSAEVDSKLPFIPVLKDFGADLVYNLEHPEECVDEIGFTTIVDLGKGRGSYLGNSRIDLLDVSWYLEYKPFVDDVIVGFVWLMFLWNLYGELPRIIHGEGSFAKMYGIIEASKEEKKGP